MSILALAWRPKSGAAVIGPGDRDGASSFEGKRIPGWVNVGNADLFCFPAVGSRTDVSTRSAPGRPADGGVLLMLEGLELAAESCVRMRVNSEECSLVLASLSERGRPSPGTGGLPSYDGILRDRKTLCIFATVAINRG